MNIILLGYMGCGKTFYAKKLSKIINLPFIDLDVFIEQKEKKSINKIIHEKGESYFREIENKNLNLETYQYFFSYLNQNHFLTS